MLTLHAAVCDVAGRWQCSVQRPLRGGSSFNALRKVGWVFHDARSPVNTRSSPFAQQIGQHRIGMAHNADRVHSRLWSSPVINQRLSPF